MTPYYQSDDATIYVGDCRDVLPRLELPAHSCVTDPPYGLDFMGQAWDAGKAGVAFAPATWEAVAAALLPGAHLLAFGGTRTSHRTTCAIEDAGFEIRDSLLWLYATGFPKSLDVGKAFDRAAGEEREIVGRKADPRYLSPATATSGAPFGNLDPRPSAPETYAAAGFETAPATDLARQWDGWGTALKPAHEPVTVARKPLTHPTVAANVAAHGTGALNIAAARIGTEPAFTDRPGRKSVGGLLNKTADSRVTSGGAGRWPANVALSHHPECNGECHPACAVAELDRQSGVCPGSGVYETTDHGPNGRPRSTNFPGRGTPATMYGDTGGASRFFFCAKPSRDERDTGCEGLEYHSPGDCTGGRAEGSAGLDCPRAGAGSPAGARNHHPTVKPVALLQWLVRLVTPPGGIVVDPFMGSGSTGIACVREGFRFIGIEQNEEYARIAVARLKHAHCETGLFAEATP